MPVNANTAARSLCDTQRSALATEVLLQSGHLQLRVYGESMLPTLWPGDVVQIKSCSLEEVQAGEIVLATREGRFFLHRFAGPGPADSFVLRGDSMPRPDPPFSRNALLGRVIGRAGFSGASTPALHSGFPGKCIRPLGQLLCRSNLARLIALKLHALKKAFRGELRHLEGVAEASAPGHGA